MAPLSEGRDGERAPIRLFLQPAFGEPCAMSDQAIFATCDLCDAHKADTSGAFRVLPPVFRDFGARRRFAGPVVTVQCLDDNSVVKAAGGGTGRGPGAGGRRRCSLRRALLGGNLGAAAARNGWAGVVIDGCVRDVAELAACDTGIRALAPMPLPTERRQQGLRDLVVKIQGVVVRPGDWLYADEDGTVVADRPLHPPA
jgi:regulator of ribonuclease activity A